MIRFILTSIAIVIAVLLLNYEAISLQRKFDSKESARVISEVMLENFDQLEKVLIVTGKRIIKEAPGADLREIHQILTQASNTQIRRNLLSWTSLGWVDLRGYQIVNTALGVIDHPLYMIGRNYRDSANDAWKLILSEITTGNISGQLIIPAGVQVETEKQKRLGTVNCGISVKEIISLINTRLNKNDRFIIIDERVSKVAFDYAGVTEIIGNNLHNYPILTSNNNLYVDSISLSPRYPYTILVGYDYGTFWLEIITISAKQITIIFSIFALIALLSSEKERRDRDHQSQ